MSFCLAAPIFDFPTPPGYTAPHQAAPGPWLVLFRKKHAKGGVYEGMLKASKTGRTWALQTAPEARLTLDTTCVEDTDVWMARLQRDRAALAERGSLPTVIRVYCDDSPESMAACSVIPTVFYGQGAGVAELSFCNGDCTEESAPAYTALLHAIAVAIPQLPALHLDVCVLTLPPPTSLPQLNSLYVSAPRPFTDSCIRSCAAYLPQLTTFSVNDEPHEDPIDWSLLFSPASTTTTLTSFLTHQCLDDSLLSRLLQHAPALEQLSVGNIDLRTDYSQRQWAVSRIVLDCNADWRSLARLPTCKETVLVRVTYRLKVTIRSPEVGVPLLPSHMPSHMLCYCSV